MNLKFWEKASPPPVKERVKSGFFSMDMDELPVNMHHTYAYGQGDMKYNKDAFLILYQTIPQLSSIVNYILDKAAEIPIRHVRYQGNGKIKDLGETDYIKLLQSPNPLDNGTKFVQDALANLMVFGNIPIQVDGTPGFDVPNTLYNQPANRIWVIPQYSMDLYGLPDQSKDQILNPVTSYKKQLDNGQLVTIDKEAIIYIRDVNPSKTGRDFYYGMSRVYAATRSIDVLGNIYDTLNSILANRGALGFIKRNSKQGEIDPGSYSDHVDEFEQKYLAKYGIKKGQRSIAATVADLSFERVSFPVTEFQPVELTSQEFDMLCNQMYGFPSPLLNSKAASTYNNVQSLERAFYTNTIKPLLATMLNGLSDGLGMSKKGEWYEADYSDIESLQMTKKEEAEAKKTNDDLMRSRFDANEITLNEKLYGMGLPPVDEGDKRKNELTQSIVTLAEKIGVGGTQSLQGILADPTMTSDQKYYSLIYLFGLDETQAKNLTNGQASGTPQS